MLIICIAHIYEDSGAHLPSEEGVRGFKGHKMFKPAKSAGHSKLARARVEKQMADHAQEALEGGEEEEEEEIPQVNIVMLCILLIVVTVLGKPSSELFTVADLLLQSDSLRSGSWIA